VIFAKKNKKLYINPYTKQALTFSN